MIVYSSESSHASQLNKLAEEIGNFIEFWGFKRIHGKIWTHLYLSPTPLNAATLIERLSISKALVSISLKDLLQHKVIIEVGKGADSTRGYVANEDVAHVIFSVLKSRELRMLTQIRSEFQALLKEDLNGPATFISPERSKQLGTLIEVAHSSLNDFLSYGKLDFPKV